jgi:uncharacterized membrane protein YfcA
MILGTWSAPRVIEHMPQALFKEFVVIVLVAVAGLMLVLG